MASKLLKDPSTAASSSEEEEEVVKNQEEKEKEVAGGDDDDDVREEEDEPSHLNVKPSQPKKNSVAAKPTPAAAAATTSAAPKTQATVGKRPLEVEKAVVKEKESKRKKKKKKVGGEDADDVSVSEDATTLGERPLEAEKMLAVVEEKESKRKKKKKKKKVGGDDVSVPKEGENDHKKNHSKWFFSKADELVILKGMIDFIKKGIEPTTNVGEFLDSIKKSIGVTTNKEQLINKMRRLNTKYKKSLKKPFTKPHDIKCSKLMKQVWVGIEGESKKGNDDSVVLNGERSMTVQLYVSNDSTLMGCTSLYKEGLALLGDAKAKELDKKWKKLQTVELENRLKRLDLEREQILAVLNALKASES